MSMSDQIPADWRARGRRLTLPAALEITHLDQMVTWESTPAVDWVMSDKITTPRFGRGVTAEELHRMDIRQIMSDNPIKDMFTKAELKFLTEPTSAEVAVAATPKPLIDSTTDTWQSFIGQLHSGDELWSWSSSYASWRALSGRAGLVIVREAEVIGVICLLMN